jgi:xanthine/CO dehydrogenase XdhC/CoxF family maturation factor
MNESELLPLEKLQEWRGRGLNGALATVIVTWGSSPRPVGSQMAINENGEFVGSVSAGCIEGAVIDAAVSTIKSGGTQILEFGVSDQTAWDVGLSCGGSIKIFLEQIT